MYLLIIQHRKTDIVHTAAALIDLFFTWNLVTFARELYLCIFFLVALVVMFVYLRQSFGALCDKLHFCWFHCDVEFLCLFIFLLLIIKVLRVCCWIWRFFSVPMYEHLSQPHSAVFTFDWVVWGIDYLSCIEAKDARSCFCGSLSTNDITYAYV